MIYPGGELVDRMGVRLHPDRDDVAILPVSPGTVRNGEFLAAALMLAADISSGIRLHTGTVTMALTTSFRLRRVAKPRLTAVTAESTSKFADQRRVIDRVDFRSADGSIVANGEISFITRRQHEASPLPVRHLAQFRAEWTRPIEEPLIEAARIETLDPSAGRVRMNATTDVRRRAGMLQGSMVTLLGEASALALAEHHFGAPVVVESLDVDFLNAAHADVLVTEARWLGEAGRSKIEAVLCGKDDTTPLASFTIGAVRADSR